MKSRPCIKIGNDIVKVSKVKSFPEFAKKSVLTDSTWTYVEIFLRQKKAKKALFYWEQAKTFYQATKNLNILAKPLTQYYCFLNATKALLTFKHIGFSNYHGVTGKNVGNRYVLQNDLITFKPSGILPSLCAYLTEGHTGKATKYTLKDILYNLQYVHRAYNVTFPEQGELFIPIKNPKMVYDKIRDEAWFETRLEPTASNKRTLNKLPGYSVDKYYGDSDNWVIRRDKVFTWKAPRNKPTKESLKKLSEYHQKVRKQLRYIYGTKDLWYIKRKDLKNNIIDRNTLTLTFAAMHRLSEMARYDPDILNH